MPKMKTQIKADSRNARMHDERNREAINKSLAELGAGRSILIDASNTTIAGNGVLAEAERLGIPIEVIESDGSKLYAIKRTDLQPDDAKRIALAVADNRASDLSVFDDTILNQIFEELSAFGGDLDLEVTGFNLDEIEARMTAAAGLPGPEGSVTLVERFGVPPFSVLDARQGYWQDRKRAWLALGIKSEVGREGAITWVGRSDPADDVSKKIIAMKGGTSIFDPVLCELMYSWFCPPGGRVLDPMAGGSVRGIVAGKLGRDYVGIDLRPEQVEANKMQAADIFDLEGPVSVAISAKWLRHEFSCTMDFIRATCKGGCCEGSDKILISLLPEEAQAQQEAGHAVEDGKLLADPTTGKCPHKQADGLCAVHGTSLKPFGCIASPFTINAGGTLIIRNRYSMMRCHGEGEPAYKCFRAGLDLIFGAEEAERICGQLDSGADTITGNMPRVSYDRLRHLDAVKKGAEWSGEHVPVWHVGDALDKVPEMEGQFDFVLSCPPYGDLEVYSDDPHDLSSMEYHTFIAAYKRIIMRTCKKLAEDRFACFVVGDFRDKKGMYRNFVSETIAAFKEQGLELYNEAILVTAIGTLPIRITKQFQAARKLGKTHQNVLVFVKGDPKKATKAIGEVYIDESLMCTDADKKG